MKRFIGLDVHAASTTFAVINESGKRVGSHVVETNGQALVEQLKTIPGDKYVCLEEGTQSAWIYEILSPHATEVVVTMVSESRSTASATFSRWKLRALSTWGPPSLIASTNPLSASSIGANGPNHANIVRRFVELRWHGIAASESARAIRSAY